MSGQGAPNPEVQVAAMRWPTMGERGNVGVAVVVDGKLALWVGANRALQVADAIVDAVEQTERQPVRVPGLADGLNRL